MRTAARTLVVATLIVTRPTISVRADEPQFSPEQIEFFENRVRPLLVEHCQKCHNGEERKGNFVLDSRDSLLNGGDTGPAVVPGDVDASTLIEAVRYGADGYQMPPDGKLAGADIATLEEWVKMGAPWPGGTAGATAAAAPFDLEARAQSWSFQPLQHPSPPAVGDREWPRTPVDRFLLAQLETAGLHPAPETDRATWIRRAYLDVIGLPPTPREVAQFVADPDPESQSRIVERLLASPHFGERWGRHWLDLVRYAESRGHEFDYDVANPWHYRDYVIRALNDDIAYDRFVVEHVAGDLLPTECETSSTRWPARFHPESSANESVVATGFWFLGEWVHSPVDIRQEEAERFANMIDVYAKSFLGLTVACARCHDHKFDPITQQDFYSLQSYLQSSVYRQALYESMDHNRQVAQRLEALREEASAALRPLLDEIAKVQANGTETVPSEVQLPESAEIIVDYAQPGIEPISEGGVFGTRVVQPGEIRLSTDPAHPIAEIATVAAVERDPLWNGVQLAAGESDDPGRLDGWRRAGHTLRTPTFEITHNKLWLLISGGCNTYVVVDSHATINGPLHGALLKEHPAAPGWLWIEHDVSRYAGHRAQLEIVIRGEEPLKVRQVIQANEPPKLIETPATDLDRLAEFVANSQAAGVDSELVRAQLVERAAPYVARQKELLKQIRPQSAAAPAMAAGTPEAEHIFIRGNWKKPGDPAPARFLQVFHEPSTLDQPSSNRLDLAAQMVDPQQTPILPRVIVNRIWQHYFARGLVPSSDDFGHMGQQPSHPELLDWLAHELVTHDWSLKHIHRLILLSAAYRMTSDAEPGPADERDPLNILLHRMPLKRLEGEIVRDQVLALSGRLDERLYGRSVPVHLTSFLEGRGRPKDSGPVDGDGRRSLYIAVRRNFPDPFLQAFDFPNPHSTIGRRSVSNVPAQALALMNNPFVIEQTQMWAARVSGEMPNADVRTRIVALYQSAFGRSPTDHELQSGEAFLTQQSQEYNCSADDPAVWCDYCHVLVNVKEFVFVR